MGQLLFEQLHPLYGVIATFRNQAHRLSLALVIFTIVLGVLGLLPTMQQPVPVLTVASKTVSQVKQVAPVTPVAATAPAPASAPAPVVTPVVAPQDCTPSVYRTPSQIDLTDRANGLSQVIDATAYYRVYGNTASQIKAQLSRCAPVVAGADGSFAAETGSTLDWQYSTVTNINGTCSISNVKVGLHINMVLPMWQPTSSAVTGLAGSWQNLISGVTTHENGHVAIYQQYANALLNDLQALPAGACESMAGSVQATSAADIAALNTANADYDTRTNHGVTQGASLR